MPDPNFCDGNITSKNIFITIPLISVRAPSTITFFLFFLKMNTGNIESPLRLGQRTKAKNPCSEGEKNNVLGGLEKLFTGTVFTCAQ